MTRWMQEFEESAWKSGGLRRALLLIGLLALRGPMLWAQDVGSSPTESLRIVSDAAALVPQLHKNISLKLSGVSVERALREIAGGADARRGAVEAGVSASRLHVLGGLGAGAQDGADGIIGAQVVAAGEQVG